MSFLGLQSPQTEVGLGALEGVMGPFLLEAPAPRVCTPPPLPAAQHLPIQLFSRLPRSPRTPGSPFSLLGPSR